MRFRRSLALSLVFGAGLLMPAFLAGEARAEDEEEPSYEDVVKEKCKEYSREFKKVRDDQVNAMLTGLSDLYKQGDPEEHARERKKLVLTMARTLRSRSEPMVKRAIELLGETDEDALKFINQTLQIALKSKPMKSEIYEACFIALGKIGSLRHYDSICDYLDYKDSDVVAHAATALLGYKDAPGRVRKEIFEEVLKASEGVYGGAEEDPSSTYAKRWNVFGPNMISAMQALSRQELGDPRQFRSWFNDVKKKDWDRMDG